MVRALGPLASSLSQTIRAIESLDGTKSLNDKSLFLLIGILFILLVSTGPGVVSGIPSDRMFHSNTACQGGDGTLVVDVENRNGNDLDSGEAILYTEDYSSSRTGQISNGEVTFYDVAGGSHPLEIYTDQREFLGSKSICQNGYTTVDFSPTSPHVVQNTFTDKGDSDGTFEVGEVVNISPSVENNDYLMDVKVEISVNGDNVTRGPVTIDEGETGYFGRDYTPSSGGTHDVEIRVYGEYGNGFQLTHIKTDSFTVNSAPESDRDFPDGTVTIEQGESLTFSVDASDVDENLNHVDWYVDGDQQTTNKLSGKDDTDSYTHTFDSTGTYTVEADVFDSQGVSDDDAVQWTVEVTQPGSTTATIDQDGTLSDDTDGDGYYEKIEIEIDGDTYFGSDTVLNNPGDPYFKVFVDDTLVKRVPPSETVVREEDYKNTIQLKFSEIKKDISEFNETYPERDHKIRIELWDQDPVNDDKIDTSSELTSKFESSAKDRPIRVKSLDGINQIEPVYSDYRRYHLNPEYWYDVSEGLADRVTQIGVDALRPGPEDVLTTIAGTGDLATSLADLTEQGFYLFGSFRAGRAGTVLSMAQQENSELRQDLGELKTNAEKIKNADSTAEKQDLLIERRTLLRETYNKTQTYNHETSAVITEGERWGVLDVCSPTNFLGWVCDETVDIDNSDADEVDRVTSELKTVLRSDWQWTNAWLANSASYSGNDISGKDELSPKPTIESINVDSEARKGETFTVRAEVTNTGEEALTQTIAVSFPDGPTSQNIQVADHDFHLDNPDDLAGGYLTMIDEGGEELGAQYGTDSVPPEYTLVEVGDNWNNGETHYLELTVTVSASYDKDTLRVYVKSAAREDAWTSDPLPGETNTVDQQGEFVKVKTINIVEGPAPPCSSCDKPTDPDDDGVYEDVNGDGSVTFLDAYRLYQLSLDDDPSLAFDVNGDDSVTFLDAYRLYQETV